VLLNESGFHKKQKKRNFRKTFEKARAAQVLSIQQASHTREFLAFHGVVAKSALLRFRLAAKTSRRFLAPPFQPPNTRWFAG